MPMTWIPARSIVAVMLFSLAVVGGAAEPLQPISTASPGEVALQRWHRSLVSGNWLEYDKVVVANPGDSLSTRRSDFEEMRKWTPETVKITAPKPLPNGNFDLFVLGCVNGRRQAASVILVKSGAGWQVLATGWSDVWGPDLKKCPV